MSVLAIVLVLVSVFVPIAFLGGLTGELYRQFAVTVAIAVGVVWLWIAGQSAIWGTVTICLAISNPSAGLA